MEKRMCRKGKDFVKNRVGKKKNYSPRKCKAQAVTI